MDECNYLMLIVFNVNQTIAFENTSVSHSILTRCRAKLLLKTVSAEMAKHTPLTSNTFIENQIFEQNTSIPFASTTATRLLLL